MAGRPGVDYSIHAGLRLQWLHWHLLCLRLCLRLHPRKTSDYDYHYHYIVDFLMITITITITWLSKCVITIMITISIMITFDYIQDYEYLWTLIEIPTFYEYINVYVMFGPQLSVNIIFAFCAKTQIII